MNYQELGFKCGLEIHQQLEGKKLFCRCPTINTDDPADIHIERRLRAAAGETGEVDIAAKYEMEKGLLFIYESSSKDTCLVELDETPPEPVNPDALTAAYEIALLLGAKIIDEIQFMRKTVVDGSNVSGFQRTALIAVDGRITTPKGHVAIPTICLEEESAKKIEAGDDFIKYRLDRLGIPLLEIATDASIRDPEHCREVAEKIGMVLRSTKHVKRGLGTIRQDVNVSIRGHARNEIKGFQDIRSIAKVIGIEVKRQLEELQSGKRSQPEVRKVEPDFSTSFLRPMPGAARMYPETDIPLIRPLVEGIKKVELIDEKIEALEERYKISSELAREMVKQGSINFDEYVAEFKHVEPSFIANAIISIPKEIKARLALDSSLISHDDVKEALNFLNEGLVSKEAVFELLADVARGRPMDIDKFKKEDDSAIEKEIVALIQKNPKLSIGAYMGMLMAKYRGKVDGKELMALLKKFVK